MRKWRKWIVRSRIKSVQRRRQRKRKRKSWRHKKKSRGKKKRCIINKSIIKSRQTVELRGIFPSSPGNVLLGKLTNKEQNPLSTHLPICPSYNDPLSMIVNIHHRPYYKIPYSIDDKYTFCNDTIELRKDAVCRVSSCTGRLLFRWRMLKNRGK